MIRGAMQFEILGPCPSVAHLYPEGLPHIAVWVVPDDRTSKDCNGKHYRVVAGDGEYEITVESPRCYPAVCEHMGRLIE